ncbi:right-handed parallel beta-helix repeat-containing protein [Methanobrevibacter sp.]|uniref:right-handed parallel beta-helix repeat-containing protein n=1 Tax=Methanobrevibacter sp. TaxID=66852 RepID=UPI0025DAB2AF|nr:right-handed parallel beta-helix repeat-containing protein [Methanobrevibacter sp.]MBR4447309.1 right-handed parallel beta-helix repeat-containing protein [Methanobrevibacter sp.]
MLKKLNILLILLLLFISITAIGATEDADMNLTSENNLDTIEVCDISDEISASEYSVSESNYGNYFDANGNLKDNVKSGDTIKFSGSFSNKNFIFNKTVTVIGESSNSMSNSVFTFLNGASGSSISNLKITNNVDMSYGIFLNSASNCVIKDCTIVNKGKSSYPICLANGANYNNVTGNNLKTSGADYGHGTRSTPTLLVSGSHNNYIASNDLQVDDANAIYLSSYSGGPITGGDSNFNIIYNNTIKYNVLPTSWSYAIQVMGGYNNIKSNKIIGAYRGISTAGVHNTITENWIVNLTGADYNNNNVEIGGENAIVGSAYSIITNNHIVNAKIVSTGSAIAVIDNSVVENNDIDVKYLGMGISAAGYNVIVRNNNISTESGVGIHEKDDGSGLLVTKNNINSGSGIGILIEKISSKRMPSNVTITFNDIITSNEYAIDASDVEEGTGIIESNVVHGKKIKGPSGIYDDSKPSYSYNESKTYTITPDNIRNYINPNGNLIGEVQDGVILKFQGTFSNEVIYVNKAIKIIGNNAKFLNSTLKVTSGGVWIENITIINKNTERLNAWGIYVNQAQGVKIIGNKINVTDPNAAYAIYVLESSYVEVINNTLISEGNFLTYTLLAYSSEDCIFANNTINTLGTGERYRYSPESSIEGTVYNVNGTEVCVDGNTVCIDGVTYCIDGNEVCIDGKVYCLDGDVLIVNGVNYTVSSNNTVCIDGNVYCIDGNTVCIDGVTYCLDGSVVCIDGNELVYNGERYPIVNNNVTIGNETYCIDGSTICIDGVTYCIDGNEVCIDGKVYCLDGSGALIVDGVRYNISANNTVCIDGNVYCIDGNTVCIDGVTYCLDGSVVCIDGNELVYNGERYPIVNNNVTIGNETYCIDGSTICIDGVTYCLDGDVICIDGKVYCLDGNELVVGGTSYGKTNHMVPEIYRTYGILLLYSSFNEVSGNNVSVTSKLDKVYPTIGINGSENSIVGIDIYYNSHNNTVSNNNVLVTGNDNYIYGVGVLGYKTGHTAPAGQGASNNQFVGNNIKLTGPYATTGIIVGDESEETIIIGNIVNITSGVTYGINLEGSDVSIIENNHFTLNSEVAYGIEGFNSDNNIIENNNIQANGKQVYGMVFSGSNNNIANNDILANGNGEEVSFTDHDSLGSGNAGIYLSGNATNNIIKSNNITSQKGFAINIDGVGNTIEDNYLKSEKGNSTAAINGTSGNNVKDNYAYMVTGAIDDVQIPYLCSGDIVLRVQNPDGISLDGAIVCFYDGDDNNIGNVTVSDGKAILNYQIDESYPSVDAQYIIKAILYKPDFKTTTFDSYGLTVIKGNLNVLVSDVSVKDGIRGKFTAKITNGLGKPVSGLTVKFYNYDTGNRQAWGTATTDSNGVATITYFIDKGFEGYFGKITTVTAIVQESEYYALTNNTGILTIIDIAPITITLSSKVGYGGILATIVDNNGLAVANKDVVVKIGGKTQNLKTNANGQIILPSASVGAQSVSISSAKDTNYAAGSVSGKVTVVAPISENKNAEVYFGNTVTYKIRIADKNGNYLGANKPIAIKVNNKVVNLKTNANGYVSYSVKNVGTYTITAEYNGQKVSNKIVIKPTLTAKNISKKKAKKIKFSVKLVNKNGKALNKKKITFKIKNKKYTAKTNKKGVATLTLKNLKVGKYTVSSSYGGCTIKNTIKIKK